MKHNSLVFCEGEDFQHKTPAFAKRKMYGHKKSRRSFQFSKR